MRTILASAALTLVAATADAAPAPVISCRAIGMTAEQGETMCIRTSVGPRLARCGMVLNVSSWTFLENGCELPREADAAVPPPAETEPTPSP